MLSAQTVYYQSQNSTQLAQTFNKEKKMSTTKTTTTQLKTENDKLQQKIDHLHRRLGGLRYHVIQESANGNDLGPTDFVRLVDNIIDEA